MKKILKQLKNELKYLFSFFINSYPDGSIGYRLRKNFWKKSLKKCGIAPVFMSNSEIISPELIEIGENFLLGSKGLLNAKNSKGIYIGNQVQIARGTYLDASNNKIDDVNNLIMNEHSSNFGDKNYSIILDDNVWIGSNSIIMAGTYLGKGCVVSAGSVINGKFENYSIIGGNPGRVIKKRF